MDKTLIFALLAAAVGLACAAIAFRAWVGLLVVEIVDGRHAWTLTAVACGAIASALAMAVYFAVLVVSYLRRGP